jgi:cellulose synthase/poly-beta-1,6-N-acetylglucosamine synthase-like glycosyltransferase
MRDESSIDKGVYKDFTVGKYNDTIKNYFSKHLSLNTRPKLLLALTGAACLTELIYSHSYKAPLSNNFFETFFTALKLSWPVGLLYAALYNLGISSFSNNRFYIDSDKLTTKKEDIKSKKVIYTLTTLGRNMNTIRDSVKSVLYWTKSAEEKYDLNIGSEAWVVTEEDSYLEKEKEYKSLESFGAKIVVVPKGYETKNKTRFKARALNYTTEMRKDLGLNRKNVWVYHQDEETMVGEDTILGNLEFILKDESVFGSGMILYDLDSKNDVMFVKELLRTPDEYRVLNSRKFGGASFGQHGSHFICRADVEDAIKWDFGEARAEDWLFAIKASDTYEIGIELMKGVAHEKAPFNFRDSLKQRRRWLLGTYELLKRHDVKLKHKLPALYNIVGWASVLPSLIASFSSLIYPVGSLFPGDGFMMGLYWASALNALNLSYQMNKNYLPEKMTKLTEKLKILGKFFYGILLDSTAPWYTLFKPTKSYENINKDSRITRA